MKKKVASPVATAGGGYIFEYLVGAIMLVHLLRGSPPPGLLVSVTEVALQQRARGHFLDDIVVHGESRSLSTEFQVKRTVQVTASDSPFVDTLVQALHTLEDRAELAASGRFSVGLIAKGKARALDELESLADWAKGHSSHDTLVETLGPGIDASLPSRLDHVRQAVAVAIERGAPDLGGVDETAHKFLSALQVWRPSVASNGRDLRDALRDLQPIADEFGREPGDVFAHLVVIAQDLGVVAGVVDADTVRRRLRWRGLIEKAVSSDQATPPREIDVDAVIRGPLKSLNLEGRLEEAEALSLEKNAAAIDVFDEIADRFAGTPFRPYTTMVLQRRAAALETEGRQDEAVLARVELAWSKLEEAGPVEAGLVLHDRAQPGGYMATTPTIERARSAAEAGLSAAQGAPLEGLIQAFDALLAGDQFRLQAAVLLAEQAVAANNTEVLVDRLGVLRAIADEAPRGSDETFRYSVRLKMCLADATGEWRDLLWEVNRDYERSTVAWAYARNGRYLALAGDGPSAQASYLQAIERGCTEKMFDDAADWLYALRYVRYLCGEFAADTHPLAQTLRARAAYSSLPGSPNLAELALGATADESRPKEAFQRSHRWKWQSVVRGVLPSEFQAVEAIGILQEKNGEIEAAIESYVRAGNTKKAKTASGKLPDDLPARLDRSLLTAVPPMRAAAFAAAAAAADVLDYEQARAWTNVAIDEITQADTGIPITQGAPALRAFDVLASMCQVLPNGQADSLLELLTPIIDNPDKFGWESWGPTAEILLALSSQPSAPPLLARAIVAGEQMAQVIIRRSDVLKAHRDVLAELLIPFAVDNRYACLAIIRSGADPEPAMELARSEVELELAPQPNDEPNSFTPHAGAPMAGILASILDEETRTRFADTVLERAVDPHRNDLSRRHDLVGLTNISINLDEATKRRLLPSVMEIARGEHVDEKRESFGIDVDFAAVALRCAAMLDPDPATCLEIEQVGLTLLRDADDSKQWEVSEALALLPLENSELDLEYCAVHPWAPVRALAAVRWAKNPAILPYGRVRRLATDPDQGVRRELARAMRSAGTPTTDESREIIAILRQDVRRSVRTAALQAGV